MENKAKQLSKELNEANEEKAVSISFLYFILVISWLNKIPLLSTFIPYVSQKSARLFKAETVLKRFLLFTPNLANESQRGRRERNRRRKGRGIRREEEGLSLPSLSLLLLHFFSSLPSLWPAFCAVPAGSANDDC